VGTRLKATNIQLIVAFFIQKKSLLPLLFLLLKNTIVTYVEQ
jgi:hypothetical protein